MKGKRESNRDAVIGWTPVVLGLIIAALIVNGITLSDLWDFYLGLVEIVTYPYQLFIEYIK